MMYDVKECCAGKEIVFILYRLWYDDIEGIWEVSLCSR